jgi:hypothetical protein
VTASPTISERTPRSGPKSWPRSGACGEGLGRVDEVHDCGAGSIVAMIIRHLADDSEVMQHENFVGEGDHLGHVGRDQQHLDAVARDAGDQLMNLDFGLDVDADRGLIDDEDVGLRREPLRDRHFLLVSARKG